MTKDYYKILDISEFSTSEEIKSAYRKMARKWHPDIAGNNDEVIKRFKEINEAYEILSDLTRKTDYDKARHFYSYDGAKQTQKKQNSSTSTFSQTKQKQAQKSYSKFANEKSNYQTAPENNSTKNGFNWEELFKKTVKPKKETKTAKRGEDIYSDIEISVFEAINGTTKIINMLQTQVCPKCNGRKFVNGAVCAHCQGKGENSDFKRFSVKIPAGIKDKSKIRLAGEGEKGFNGGKNGDLYLTVHITENKNYKTEGLNILKTVSISPALAVIGGDISVQTLKGNVSVKISPRTKNGQKIRLSGCGIEHNSKTGDMILTLEIQIPDNLSEGEIKLYNLLKEIEN